MCHRTCGQTAYPGPGTRSGPAGLPGPLPRAAALVAAVDIPGVVDPCGVRFQACGPSRARSLGGGAGRQADRAGAVVAGPALTLGCLPVPAAQRTAHRADAKQAGPGRRAHTPAGVPGSPPTALGQGRPHTSVRARTGRFQASRADLLGGRQPGPAAGHQGRRRAHHPSPGVAYVLALPSLPGRRSMTRRRAGVTYDARGARHDLPGVLAAAPGEDQVGRGGQSARP